MKKYIKYLLAVAALIKFGMDTASAQTVTNDPTTLYTLLSAPFNAALSIKIGFMSVMLVIAAIKFALRFR